MRTEKEIRTAIDALTCEIELNSNSPPMTLEDANLAGMYAALRWAVGEGPAKDAFAELMRRYPRSTYSILRDSDGEPTAIQVLT